MAEPSADLLALVQSADLLGIEYYELSARRVPATGDAEGSRDEAIKPEYALFVDIAKDRGRFRLRLRIQLGVPGGLVTAEAAAEYSVGDFPREQVEPPLLVQYANNVAVMALVPYLRQVIADLTLRVFGDALLMPVVPRGALEFGVGPEADSGEPGTGDVDAE